jgi:hypothetical protein
MKGPATMTPAEAATRYVEDPAGTYVLVRSVREGVEVVTAHEMGPRPTRSYAHHAGRLDPLAIRYRRVR